MAYVYLLLRKGKVIYVGKTSQEPEKRIAQHWRKAWGWDDSKLFRYRFGTEVDLEKELIAKYEPLYNVYSNPRYRWADSVLPRTGGKIKGTLMVPWRRAKIIAEVLAKE